MSQLQGLSKVTGVVADTGDFKDLAKYKPMDATTNPSLLYKAAQMPEYAHLVEEAVSAGKAKFPTQKKAAVSFIMDKLAVLFGREILKIVPGLVSTEIDARLSFNTAATVAKAHEIIALYKESGIAKERILIKIASTWEGIRACEILESEGIHCNMTLLFSIYQAVAAAEAGATLISPFVGRITDWHKAKTGVKEYTNPAEDPGVQSVSSIYNYYKKHGHSTVVMGASFRNKFQILQLAGCDKLTVAPTLLEQLSSCNDPITTFLTKENAAQSDSTRIDVSEPCFRYDMNEDAMATEKLAEGIRKFAVDTVKLEELVAGKL